MAAQLEVTDGVVTLRSPRPGDAALMISARDEEFHLWLGPGSDDPRPSGCIVLLGEVVGWIDYDHDAEHDWLADGEVNVGYFVFAKHRGRGYASRAVELLLEVLTWDGRYTTATLLIDPRNEASLAVARRCGFESRGELRGQRYFRRSLA